MISPYVYPGLEDITFAIRQPSYLFKRLTTIVGVNLDISQGDILSSRRYRKLVLARQMISYMLRKEYEIYLTAIGRLFGKHHSTIIHYIKTHEQDFETNRKYRELYIHIKEQIL